MDVKDGARVLGRELVDERGGSSETENLVGASSNVPPCYFQCAVVSLYQILEAEVVLVDQVVHQVRKRNLVPIQNECLGRHKLHKLLAEISHEPLLKERDDHAPFGTQVELFLILGPRGRVKSVDGFHDSPGGQVVVELLNEAFEDGIFQHNLKQLICIKL